MLIAENSVDVIKNKQSSVAEINSKLLCLIYYSVNQFSSLFEKEN
jgi:hypothetical protein